MLASELIIQNKSCRYSNHEFKSLPSEDSGLMVAVSCLNKHSCLNIHIAQFHIIYFPHGIKFSLPNFPIMQNSHIIRLMDLLWMNGQWGSVRMVLCLIIWLWKWSHWKTKTTLKWHGKGEKATGKTSPILHVGKTLPRLPNTFFSNMNAMKM